MQHLKWGIQTSPQHVSYGELLQVWQRADALGYDSAWLFDHFMPIFSDPTGPCFEGWTMLTALGVQTRKIHVGLLVTSMVYRNPGLLANIGATVDVVTGGRMEMGVGAGWFEQEARAYGMEFLPAGERLKQLDEGVQVIKSLWTNPVSNFQGRYYQLTEAHCEPKPVQLPHPPIWIGGQGEKVTLRIVAQQADGWDMDMFPLDEYRRKLDILAEHCYKAGRAPESVRKMIHFPGLISDDEKSLKPRVEAMARSWNTNMDNLRQRALIGTPEQAAEHLLKFVELGVEHFVLSIAPPYDMRMIELFIEEVAPRVRQAAGAI
ncbi:MAG: LLM class F420-dependent oxidoreductase [Chloroflexi bacterium]|nr:LLM class F420-dependent oxidoreductase [Chloroflexota bacterium]